MVKSSFHENKTTESTANSSGGNPVPEKAPFLSNTPPRRAPRMSEGGMYEPGSIPTSFPKGLDLKQPIGEKVNESPLIKKPKEQL